MGTELNINNAYNFLLMGKLSLLITVDIIISNRELIRGYLTREYCIRVILLRLKFKSDCQ